jgi:hypothetical protein
VNRADGFLRTEALGKHVLSYVHFGAAYHGHRYLRAFSVDGGQGEFALVYRFNWEDDGVTDVAFYCDANGKANRVGILYTNAFLNQPFVLADVSIQVLGHGLIELYKDKLSREDRQTLDGLVNRADAKGLLEFSLRTQQLFR